MDRLGPSFAGRDLSFRLSKSFLMPLRLATAKQSLRYSPPGLSGSRTKASREEEFMWGRKPVRPPGGEADQKTECRVEAFLWTNTMREHPRFSADYSHGAISSARMRSPLSASLEDACEKFSLSLPCCSSPSGKKYSPGMNATPL